MNTTTLDKYWILWAFFLSVKSRTSRVKEGSEWVTKTLSFDEYITDNPYLLQIQREEERSKLVKILKSYLEDSSGLTATLQEMEKMLVRVETVFKENRFAPFWSSVEDCAALLSRFQQQLTRLQKTDFSQYRKICEDKKFVHNFPPLRPPAINFGRVRRIAARLDMLVRKAESIIDFALIYEHRATRKEIVRGFRGLSEAVESLSTNLERAICELGDSLADVITEVGSELQGTMLYVSSEQIEAMREATGLQIEALDLVAGLQNHNADMTHQLIDISRESEETRSAQRLLVYEEAQKHTDALDDIRRGRIPSGDDPRKWDTIPKR